MTCGDGLLFNPNGMNCDLPGRVDCGDRPLDSAKGNHEDIRQGQFSDPITDQKTVSHGQPLKIQEENAIGDRERNESLPLKGGHYSEQNAHNPEKPNLMAVHGPRDDKQSLKAGGSSPSHSEFDDTMKAADDTHDTPSIQLGVDFRENKKEEKSDDSTQTDSNHVKTTSSKDPVLHVLINGDTNLTPMSSSSKSDDEASKSRPSFHILVNKDGIKASLGRSQEERKKMDDSSHSDSETQKPKHTFNFVINDDNRKRVQDEIEGSSPGASKQGGTVGGGDEERISKPNFELTVKNNKDQEDQRQKQLDHHGNNNEKQGQTTTHGGQGDDQSVHVNAIHDKEIPIGRPTQNQIIETIKQNVNEAKNVDKEVKVEHMNGANKEQEPGMDIEMIPPLPLHDQNISTNASRNTKAMNPQSSSDNIPLKTPVNVNSGTSKGGVQGDSNNSKEEIKKFQNNTQVADNQDKITEIRKIKVKEIESPEPNNAQQPNYQGHLPITGTTTKPIQASSQESLRFKPPQTAFKHPLEALSFENQRQPGISKEQLKVTNEKSSELHDSSLEHDSIESSQKKIDEPDSEKESEKPEKAMDTSDATTPQNSEGQAKVKRPTLDILVNGDSGRTTELRMRNSNNEIARLNDAGGKQATNRNPVVGITIRQKGGPDHHILFSKRQRLLNHKLRHHHKHH